jgi:hypothetical protein
MRTKGLLLLAVVTLLAAGCARQPVGPIRTTAASVPATEAIPGGGIRANLVRDGLHFTAEVTSTVTTESLGSSVIVRLRLTNTGSRSVSWTNLRLGLKASIVDPQGHPSMLWDGLGPRIGGAVIGTPAHRPPPPATATLASGQTTSTVVRTGPVPGTYTIRCGYEGDTGPSGTAPPIVVVVLSGRRR